MSEKIKGPIPTDKDTVLIVDKPSGLFVRMHGDLPNRDPPNVKVKTIEYVEVTVEVPKGIMDFLKDNVEDVKAYLEYSIVQFFGADLDTLDMFNIKEPKEAKQAIEQHGLNEVLKETAASEFC